MFQAGSVLGFLLIGTSGCLQRILYPEIFDLPLTGWIAALSMPPIGCAMGFVMATAGRLALPQKRAIAYETGTQNVSVALTIIAFSFPEESKASKFSQIPLLYAAAQLVTGLTSSFVHQSYYRLREKTTPCHQVSRWCRERKGISGEGHNTPETEEALQTCVVDAENGNINVPVEDIGPRTNSDSTSQAPSTPESTTTENRPLIS